jgi:hypothetical protein
MKTKHTFAIGLTVVLGGLVIASAMDAAQAARGGFYSGPDPRCSWYKQQAMNEGRTARSTTGSVSAQHKAKSDAYWQQYNACLRGNDW